MLIRRTVPALAAAALILTACGADDTTGSAGTTTTVGTTASSGTVPVGVTIETEFESSATPAQASQAAEVMTERLTNYGFPGSTADVNADGSGLTITVAGATSKENALQILQPLTVNGALYFRPVLQGPIAPAAGDPVSPQTADVLNQISPGSTLPGSSIVTTDPSADDPAGESVLVQPDKDGALIARWMVGPVELDATAVADANATTYNDSPAVQIVMKAGTPGIDEFNTMAEGCFQKQPTCPTGLYTVIFDSQVVTATQVSPTATSYTPFSTTGVILWSPDWTADQAKAVTAIVKVGEMPVQLVLAR